MGTIEDNAIVILKNLKEGALSLENLTPDMRRVCVAYLDDEGMKNEEMAHAMQVSCSTISQDLQIIRDSFAKMITTIDYKRVLSTYLRDAHSFKKKALREKDYRLAWQIDNDLLDKLMELGYLKRAPDELIVKTQKAEDLTVDEAAVIDSILMKVAERKNKRENAGLLGDGKEWLVGGDNGGNGDGKGSDNEKTDD